MEILRIQDVTMSFGKMNALHEVNCAVEPHELLAVIGPNGAGKTTFFNVITGKYKPSRGQVFFKGERIDGLSRPQIINKGIGRSFQVVNLFPDLTVAANVRIGVLAHQKQTLRLFKNVDKMAEVDQEVERILDLVHLGDEAGVVATTLSHGDQKCLEMGMALTNHPALLLLDEPTAGMGPEETRQSIELIKDVWRKTGVTIVFTEHDLDMVFNISTRVLVLQSGKLIADGSVKDIRNNPRVKEAYLGEEA
ncbi:MAG: ABC transporter ATP-binding protein [Desulfarculaceae bacterium]|nr:ABC transporter ATP-binding protein [Desulfarculaceae bacterium]MCF8071172.1 ABC transporter ATP-binding protein [Desulfarculaceae bacterium]MCF8101225.1 ABC transporter ATP-binding protein [Desulfarculaceae bacterium]MCF8115226.1 ABC transporter ATP-binding protein [Desulfarculaceae bacterium]